MSRIALLTDEVGWHTRQLQAALRARGAVGRCLDLASCALATGAPHGLQLPGFGDGLPDAVLVRGIAGGSFEQVTQRLGVLHALHALGVPVVNAPAAIERSVDKGMTSWCLARAGVPTPPAWLTESRAQAQRIVMREAAAGHAVVLKPLFGSQGRGLRLAGWVGGRFRALPSRSAGGTWYLQRRLPTPGWDWRVFVIGGRAIAAMRRVSAHWIHNVARGARCERAPLSPALVAPAEAAARALGLDVAGVDLMPSAVGAPVQVIEVNGVAAWRGLQQVTERSIAAALVDHLLDRARAHEPRRA